MHTHSAVHVRVGGRGSCIFEVKWDTLRVPLWTAAAFDTLTLRRSKLLSRIVGYLLFRFLFFLGVAAGTFVCI